MLKVIFTYLENLCQSKIKLFQVLLMKKNVDQDRAKESPVEKLEDLLKLMLFLEQGAQIQVCYTYSQS